jgi:PTH1 family peptidyl-tRNA hydrolase
MEQLHLIVGLGNPGRNYARTRHNVGFMLTDLLAERWRAGNWAERKKFKSRVARVERDGRQVILAQPQTFMNASGEAVGAMMQFYRVPAGRLVVAVDDADLPLGELRLRASGSSGGHHGLENIEQHLGSRDYARLRIGIGRTADGRREITGHVLAPFSGAEADLLDRVLRAAAGQVERWLDAGIEQAMNEFNGVVKDPGNQRQTE